MKLAFTTSLLAAAGLAAAICVPAYADDAPTPPAEQSVLPQYNQLPQNYEEFAAVYNKALAVLRDAGVQSIHKCSHWEATRTGPTVGVKTRRNCLTVKAATFPLPNLGG